MTRARVSSTSVVAQALGLTSPTDDTLRPVVAIVTQLMNYNTSDKYREVVTAVRMAWTSGRKRGSQIQLGFALLTALLNPSHAVYTVWCSATDTVWLNPSHAVTSL